MKKILLTISLAVLAGCSTAPVIPNNKAASESLSTTFAQIQDASQDGRQPRISIRSSLKVFVPTEEEVEDMYIYFKADEGTSLQQKEQKQPSSQEKVFSKKEQEEPKTKKENAESKQEKKQGQSEPTKESKLQTKQNLESKRGESKQDKESEVKNAKSKPEESKEEPEVEEKTKSNVDPEEAEFKSMQSELDKQWKYSKG